MQRIGQAHGLTHQKEVCQIDLIEGGDDGLVDPERIVGPVDAEGGLNDRKIDVELDTCRSTQLEIGAGGDGELRLLVYQREELIDVLHTGGIELQSALVENAGGAGVEEQGHADRAGDRNAVFEVGNTHQVAAGESDGVGEERNRKGGEAWIRATGVAGESHRLIEGARNIGDGRNGANIEAAYIVFAAHVEAAVRGNFLAAISGGPGPHQANADSVAPVVDGME